ncbi:hypothetical protein TCAL_15234 [Tigriopus californicus]|uniref:Uncharacterized protein n=1 Tax=Tigriopus californicus TaxID=6832 RepID=A0A553NBW4_TIGCA|nr:hypothetical protein TCAL_15234 [Tigriopus californicus]
MDAQKADRNPLTRREREREVEIDMQIIFCFGFAQDHQLLLLLLGSNYSAMPRLKAKQITPLDNVPG